MVTRLALFPGSFDPLTNGHVDLVHRGLRLFDQVEVGLAVNASKRPLFTVQDRKDMIRATFGDDPRVRIGSLKGLLVEYAREIGAVAILRGLRSPADFDYELKMTHMNRHLHGELETVFLASAADQTFISSSLVKEVARLGGDVSAHLPPHIHAALAAKLQEQSS